MSSLVLSPHIDDEVLGCFGFLTPSTHVLYGGVESRPGMPRELRMAELEASAGALGFSWSVLEHTVNHFVAVDLIAPVEALINRLQPDTVLIPEPSYNQDHRAMYDAALVATRPHDTLHRVSRVLIFEQPHSVLWSHSAQPEPGYFQPIDIDLKIEAYARYASQVRGHRSPETVRALATLRGAQIGEAAAEAYRIKRWIGARGATAD